MDNSNIVKVLQPDYYDNFKCIGSECKHTCCTGWTITIDKETHKKYRGIKDARFGMRLDKYTEIIPNSNNNYTYAKIKLNGGSCALMDENGWCNIHKYLGEDHLCVTCRVYPRIVNSVFGSIYRGMTLSCEAVCSALLTNKEIMTFNEIEMDLSEIEGFTQFIRDGVDGYEWKKYYEEYRYTFVTILQDRRYTIKERLLILALMSNEIDLASSENAEKIPNILGSFLDSDFKGCLDGIEVRSDIHYLNYRTLTISKLKHKLLTEDLLEYFSNLVNDLDLDAECTFNVEREIERLSNIVNNYMDNNSHIIENYLVNSLLLYSIPVDGNSVLESYTKLLLRYTLLMGLSMTKVDINDNLKEEDILDIIRSIERGCQHTSYFSACVSDLSMNGGVKIEDLVHLITV